MVPAWPLVGRAADLDRAIELTRSGGVLLVGPSGVGKSRLAAEVMDRTPAARSIRVRATAASAAMPLGAFAPALAAHGEEPSGPDAARLADAGARLLAGLGEDDRLALWVDDVHSLDETSATLLLGLATSGRAQLVLTMRSGEPVPEPITVLWRDELVGRLDVEPLAREDVVELLDLVLPGGADGLAAATLASACAGNLLYLRELVLGLQQSGELAEIRGRWFLRGPISAPPRLTELIAERLDALGEGARRMLEAVALAEPFGCQQIEQDGNWALVEELLAAGLVEVVRDGRRRQIRSVHPLHIEVARASMPEAARRRHLRTLIERAGEVGLRRRDDRRRLAAWQLELGVPADPEVLVEAAQDALVGADPPGAERFARAALAGDDRRLDARASYLLGVSLDDQGRFAEADAVLEGADRSLGDDRDRMLLALARSGVLLRGLNRREEAERELDEAAAVIADPVLLDELVAQRAAISLFAGEVDRTLSQVEELLGRGDDRAFCEGALQASVAHMLAGHGEEAMRIATRAFEVRISLGEQVQLAAPGIHLVSLSLAQLEHGRVDDAIATARAAYEVAVEQRDRHGQAWLSVALGRALLVAGRLPESVRFAREAAVVFGELRHPGARWGFGALALAAGHAGDATTAADAVADLDAEPETPLTIMDAELHRARAWAAVASADPTAAVLHLGAAIQHARSLGQSALEAAAVHDLARIGASRPPVDLAARIEELAARVDGALMEARVGHVVGTVRRDADLLGQAAQRFAACGARLFAAEAARSAAAAAVAEHRSRDAATWQSLATEQLSVCPDARTPALAAVSAPSPLTPREREVAALAAGGLANREIADRLVVSVRTVENHLQRVYDKLGIRSRDQLVPLVRPAEET